jgi:hypothetical protein
MRLVLVVIWLAVLALTGPSDLRAASVTMETLYTFAPVTGPLPSEPLANSHRSVSLHDSSNPPTTIINITGEPPPGETNTLLDSVTGDTSTYEVTSYTLLSNSLAYGVASGASAAGPSTSQREALAFNSLAFHGQPLLAGTLSASFDCALAIGGLNEVALCGVNASLSPLAGNLLYVPVIAWLDLRDGFGQAAWDGQQIFATGTDYTLSTLYGLDKFGSSSTDTTIRVENGLVVSVEVTPDSLFDLSSLPSVGSSGTFFIDAPVNPVPFDLGVLGDSQSTLSLGSRAHAFLIDPTPQVPEPGTAILLLIGVGALALTRLRGRSKS